MNIIELMNKNLDCIWDLIDYNADTIKIEISWGDWKHDHLRADWFMGDNGWVVTETYTTEDDGSDCYSGVHVYKRFNI